METSNTRTIHRYVGTEEVQRLVYRPSWRTLDEAENAIFGYIDGWYNTRRIQKGLGYLSPDEYETAWHARTEPDNLTPAPAGGR